MRIKKIVIFSFTISEKKYQGCYFHVSIDNHFLQSEYMVSNACVAMWAAVLRTARETGAGLQRL